MSITVPGSTGNFNMLKDVEKGVSVFILLCVGQLWLVAVFIVRAFEVSVYAVFS